jgi:hypothetical protein
MTKRHWEYVFIACILLGGLVCCLGVQYAYCVFHANCIAGGPDAQTRFVISLLFGAVFLLVVAMRLVSLRKSS